MKFSHDQEHALERVRAWLSGEGELGSMTLGGLAGTGKTTLIHEIMSWQFCAIVAYTGKAAFVLRQKGVTEAQTIHRLIYTPNQVCKDCGQHMDVCERAREIWDETPIGDRIGTRCPAGGNKTRFVRVPDLSVDFIIVDEASMVSQRLYDDLESYGKKILYVGDHGQLEPIGSDPRLMRDPQIRLEVIHRQAADNPIVQFAHDVRRGWAPEWGRSDTDAGSVMVREGAPRDIHEYDAVLVGFNKTRVAVNDKVRERRGFHDPERPEVGERVICLRNDYDQGLFNGMQATVTDRTPSTISIVDDVGNEIEGIEVMWDQFGHEKTIPFDDLSREERRLAQFDYGYAMTVHKSQGSEWKRVCVLEQIAPMWSADRWRYTAATRAANDLCWCLPAGGRR